VSRPLVSIVIAAAVLAAPCGAQPSAAEASCTGRESPYRLFVRVENVRTDQGLIAVSLYPDDSRRFLAKRGSLYVGRVAARAPVTRVCIHIPKPGVYALGVYHDADANRRFNRRGIGFPAEAFGFSNNPATLFGMPSFRSVRLDVETTDTETSVRLHYP
jgi:uncharacterized protein (DUF2141 family)